MKPLALLPKTSKFTTRRNMGCWVFLISQNERNKKNITNTKQQQHCARKRNVWVVRFKSSALLPENKSVYNAKCCIETLQHPIFRRVLDFEISGSKANGLKRPTHIYIVVCVCSRTDGGSTGVSVPGLAACHLKTWLLEQKIATI